MGKLINRIPGSRLLIPTLLGSALRNLVNSVLQALPGKLDIKSLSPKILYLSCVVITISHVITTSHLSIVHIKRDIL